MEKKKIMSSSYKSILKNTDKDIDIPCIIRIENKLQITDCQITNTFPE
jgi:hypothetical protein